MRTALRRSAVKKSGAQVDSGGAKQLKAALAEAQAGMGGVNGSKRLRTSLRPGRSG